MASVVENLMLQEYVNHVLGMAQRDAQELLYCSTSNEGEIQALEAMLALNSAWYLLEASPLLYSAIKGALPYLEQELKKTPTSRLRRIVVQARKAVDLAERQISTDNG